MIISFREIENGLSQLRNESQFKYSVQKTSLRIYEQPGSQEGTLISYMDKNFHIYGKSDIENYNTYYKDRKTCTMIKNTAENRDQYIK